LLKEGSVHLVLFRLQHLRKRRRVGLPCLVHGGTETSTKHTFLTTKQERHRPVGLFVTGAQLLKISLSQSGACPPSFNATTLFLKI